MDVKKLMEQMTLEEKAGLCSGEGLWHTKAVERLGIRSMMVSDGPHGLRKQEGKVDRIAEPGSTEAVCFPTGSCTACSFDPKLLQKLGETLGDECRAEGIAVLLGPAANSKRSPLCGRNFEYFSEDPYLTGRMAAAYIRGVQSRGVGTSLKHFAANNQEYRRMSTSANIGERALREIYLSGFETAVKEAEPWTVMCSYNRINGEFSSENKRLLTDILRKEWGFGGFVMSDWGAVNDRVKGVAAGLDLEMPGSGGVNDAEIVKAVKSGKLSEQKLNEAAEHILNIVNRYYQTKKDAPAYSKKAHHEIARESMVLLKNEGNVLPLSKREKTAFIGRYAKTPRYQGGGSSHINSFRVTGALEAASGKEEIVYADGYAESGDQADDAQIAEAVAAAKAAKTAVVFAGLPESYESEGFDRRHMRLPECQNRLISEVCRAQPDTVVVLHNGSPVEMPWIDEVKGVLEAYLGGQAVGEAEADLLFGDCNPCGKLAETFPLKLSDNPSYLTFPGEGDETDYAEGIFTGYRYYDKKELPVLFPFGHGLSYTGFSYGNLKLSAPEILDTDTLKVSVTVKNTGKRFGKEIVQLYVKDEQTRRIRPVKELKGIAKVALEPGEEKEALFTLSKRSFAYYDEALMDWKVQSGTFDLLIGKSSRDIVLTARVTVHSTAPAKRHFTENSTVGDVMESETGKKILFEAFSGLGAGMDPGILLEGWLETPLRTLRDFGAGKLTNEWLFSLVDRLNASEQA